MRTKGCPAPPACPPNFLPAQKLQDLPKGGPTHFDQQPQVDVLALGLLAPHFSVFVVTDVDSLEGCKEGQAMGSADVNLPTMDFRTQPLRKTQLPDHQWETLVKPLQWFSAFQNLPLWPLPRLAIRKDANSVGKAPGCPSPSSVGKTLSKADQNPTR